MVTEGPQGDARPGAIATEIMVRVVVILRSNIYPSTKDGPTVPTTAPTDSEPVATAVTPVTTNKGDASDRPIPTFFAVGRAERGDAPRVVGPPDTASCPGNGDGGANRVGTGLRPEWTKVFPLRVGECDDIPVPLGGDAITKLV